MAGANTLGKRLRWLREQRGLSLDAIADVAGVSRQYIRQMELGQVGNPTVATLIGLSDALNVDAAGLFVAAVSDQRNALLHIGVGQARKRSASPSPQPQSLRQDTLCGDQVSASVNTLRHLQTPDLVSAT